MVPQGQELVIATRNEGKVKEFRQMFAPFGIRVKSLNDFVSAPDIVEDGATFAENARIKARAVAEAYGTLALADDSGLCVDELGGAPGVYSARYAGPGATDRDNNAKLLAALKERRMRRKAAGRCCSAPRGLYARWRCTIPPPAGSWKRRAPAKASLLKNLAATADSATIRCSICRKRA